MCIILQIPIYSSSSKSPLYAEPQVSSQDTLFLRALPPLPLLSQEHSGQFIMEANRERLPRTHVPVSVSALRDLTEWGCVRGTPRPLLLS